MKFKLSHFIPLLVLFFSVSLAAKPPQNPVRVTQTLVPPPALPEHTQIAQGPPKIVQITLSIEEKEIEVADGVYIQAMTFNGSVPGPMIVVHQNDWVEVTLKNPATNSMLHNIDFHAATGAMGGGELTRINPGEQVTLKFKATKAGVFVYHCAPGGSVTPFHVVAGMSGAIMVLPRNGLKGASNHSVRYDKAFYIGEQDFYIPRDSSGQFIRYASISDAVAPTEAIMKTLTPSFVVFNGRVNALTGSNAMTADVGDNVLVIHSQANRDSRPHIIGGHADLVWPGGAFDNKPIKDLETWFVAGGSAVAAIYKFRQPGIHAYVNHNLIEAVLLGAAAHFQINGEWDHDLMTQVSPPSPIP
ncbi:copper-containing nitrite reductase [Pleionea sp. CnH1-48]|uniref:copper-containing nitrite reductase n=1 Tax=Pleionea sp. CnH1-48 TaxID=2954494 RepID=UPI0020968EF5|nr:copper-containing nitrite reductase [Pleionea sp. CnH1-48]MCO7222744.1 copper-containing nitrite reductase [Pleionea sp. CnH1-48]